MIAPGMGKIIPDLINLKMKKILSFCAALLLFGGLSAQSTPEANNTPQPEQVKCCAKGDAAKAGCCAARSKASAEASTTVAPDGDAPSTTTGADAPAPACHGAKTTAAGSGVAPEAKTAGCCAGKAGTAGSSCHRGRAHADATAAPKP